MKTGTLYLLSAVLGVILLQGSAVAKSEYIPDNIISKITEQAQKRYPENSILQQNTIKLQKRAYFRVRDYQHDQIPSQEMNMIKNNAAREYPYNYVGQLSAIDKKAKTYLANKQKTEPSTDAN